MKHFLLVLSLLVLGAADASAQANHIYGSGTLPSSCRVGDVYVKTGASAGHYSCVVTNTWEQDGTLLGNNSPSLTSPSKVVHVNHNFTGALGSATFIGVQNETYWTPSGSWSGSGVSFLTTGAITGTQNATSTYYGIQASMASTTSGTILEEIGERAQVFRTTGTTTYANGLDVYAVASSSGTISNWFGFRARPPSVSGGGSIGTGYGLFMDEQTQSGCTNCGPFFISMLHSGRYALASSPYQANNILGLGSFAFGYFLITTSNSELSPGNYNEAAHYSWELTPTATVTKPTVASGLETLDASIVIHAAFGIDPLVAANGGDAYIADGSSTVAQISGVYGEADHYGTGTVTDMSAFISFVGIGTGATATLMRSIAVTAPYDLSGTVVTNVGVDIENQAYAGADAWAMRYTNVDGLKTGVTAAGAQVDTPGVASIGASGTLTPSTTLVKLTCTNAGGCTITLGESGIKDGQVAKIVNISANTANFADTSGVSELAGAFAMGQWDSLSLLYVTDRWVETGRSNN